MDQSNKPTQRPQTGSHKKRSTMIKSMAHMSDNAGVDGVQRPKSAPKPVTPSSKHRDGNKAVAIFMGIKTMVINLRMDQKDIKSDLAGRPFVAQKMICWQRSLVYEVSKTPHHKTWKCS